MRTFFLTLLSIAGMSLVLPLYLWGATGNLRASFAAWWAWWRYMLAAVAIVGSVALLVTLIERIG